MTTTNDAPAPGEGMEEMAAIAQIVSEWRHGPLLSPEALRRIRASLARDASPRGEAVAWVPQSHLDFLAEGRANNRPSNALVHDRPNEEMGWTVPLYAHPAPAPAPAEVVDFGCGDAPPSPASEPEG